VTRVAYFLMEMVVSRTRILAVVKRQELGLTEIRMQMQM
jgi:hypothetical protein